MKLTSLLVLILAFFSNGCGDDGGSGVDPDKSVTEVTKEEAMQICEASLGSVGDLLVELNCTVKGVVAEAESTGDCETVRDECIENPDPEDSDEGVNCEVTDQDLADVADCTGVTVGDLEECFGDQREVFEGFAGQVTCESTLAELEMLDEPDDQASCKAQEEKCPGFADDE